jgi:hypothetical protein
LRKRSDLYCKVRKEKKKGWGLLGMSFLYHIEVGDGETSTSLLSPMD